jgi:anti-sigma factor RsiW
MDCRQFRDKHSEYVDARCGNADERAMRQHLGECEACARHDTRVRRGLLLVRNLPRIEPSPDFQARLAARLRSAESVAQPRWFMRPSFGAFAALAAAIAFVTFVASATMRRNVPQPIRLQPIIASLPEYEASPSPVATPAFVATVPTGMSVWPAIMVATQAPMHFVAAELASER